MTTVSTPVSRPQTDRNLAEKVQRYQPFGKLDTPRALSLTLDQLHPVIRIAHRPKQALEIAERIIFDHELVLILAGSGELIMGRQRLPFAAHDLLFIPPFAPHQFTAADKSHGEHIAVHFDLAPNFPAFADDPDRRPPYQVQINHTHQLPPLLSLGPGHRIETSFSELLRERENADSLSARAVANHLTTILISMLRMAAQKESPEALSPTHARNQRRVTAVIESLHAHFSEPLTAADLAETAGISQSRLNTLFQQMTGYSPMEYLRRVRVEEARRLLGDINLSIKEIAARTGFEDAYHFSKVFRRIDGLSPTDYRAALLATHPGKISADA